MERGACVPTPRVEPSTGDSSGLTTYWGPIEAAAGMGGCGLNRVEGTVEGGYSIYMERRWESGRGTLFLLHVIK
jgi:hypothetical protein